MKTVPLDKVAGTPREFEVAGTVYRMNPVTVNILAGVEQWAREQPYKRLRKKLEEVGDKVPESIIEKWCEQADEKAESAESVSSAESATSPSAPAEPTDEPASPSPAPEGPTGDNPTRASRRSNPAPPAADAAPRVHERAPDRAPSSDEPPPGGARRQARSSGDLQAPSSSTGRPRGD